MVFISIQPWDATYDFHFRDLEIDRQGQVYVWPCSDLQMTSKKLFKVKGRDARLVSRQWWTFLSIGNRLDDMSHFHLRDLEMTQSRSSEVKCFCGFWKPDIDFPIVFHSNYMLISHHSEDIGDFQSWPKGQSRSTVKMHFY